MIQHEISEAKLKQTLSCLRLALILTMLLKILPIVETSINPSIVGYLFSLSYSQSLFHDMMRCTDPTGPSFCLILPNLCKIFRLYLQKHSNN